MFRKEHFPRVSMNPQEANYAYLRGEVELVRLPDAEGRIAAEGALPYPSGCAIALFRVKSGVVLFCVLLQRSGRRDQPVAGFCTGASRVSISKNMMVVSKFGAMSSSPRDAQKYPVERGKFMSQAKSNKMGVVQLTHTDDGQHDGLRYHHAADKACRSWDNFNYLRLVTAVGSMALAWAFAKCGMFSRKSRWYGRLCRVCFR